MRNCKEDIEFQFSAKLHLAKDLESSWGENIGKSENDWNDAVLEEMLKIHFLIFKINTEK